MIIVTGGAGFIGSNIVRRLNESGRDDIIVVDDLADGHKAMNLADCRIADYFHHENFLAAAERDGGLPAGIEAVLHQGACTDTTEWDGRLMMRLNFDFSKAVLAFCERRRVPLVYASSASVYGAGREFRVDAACERPINVYAWSKLAFDQYLRARQHELGIPVTGLRYFNVYGPREQHKGRMASVMYHFHGQLSEGDEVRLYDGSDGYGPGEQRRDFIHVDDVVAVNLWFLGQGDKRGIYNLGTGCSQTFNEVAEAVIAWHGHGRIRYIPFPDSLRGSYQSFTEADLTGLRAAGYEAPFMDVQGGVPRYLDALGD